MRTAVSGALATAMTLALTATASAQSTTTPYLQQAPSGYQFSTIQPAATTTYQTQTIAQPTSNAYAPQAGATYLPQQQPAGTYSVTTPSYGSPYTPTQQAPTYVAPTFGAVEPAYQPAPVQNITASNYNGQIVSQPLPAPLPASASTSSVPVSTAPRSVETASAIQDTDAWSFNFARFYPAVQACLRRSTAKNPVIANIQVQDNKTMMLIGEGGSANYAVCSTGLTGTTVKANSQIRSVPPAFFAPLGSTFTLSPERPFQPIVDTDQKVIGWLVRTQPTQAVNQFGQAVGFDGQFIAPMMVNTNVGKS